jgi:cobalt-zinc-cadmium efflux system protein
MSHNRHDHHGHNHAPGQTPGKPGSYALPIALFVTLGFAGVEALAGWLSGSLALMSDAGHMLTDSLALALATVAARIAHRPVTEQHSYGLRRVETLAGLVNGLFMLLVVGLIITHAAERLLDPQPVDGGTVMLVALIGLVINVVVAWMLSHGGHDLNTRAALLHVLGDLLGSVAALASGAVIHFTGWLPIDPLLSMLICGLILAATLRLLKSATHTLLDGVPARLSLSAIGQAMARSDGVISVHDLHIWSLDSNHTALSAHIVIKRSDDWPNALARLQTLLRDEYEIEHVTLQPEIVDTRVVAFPLPPSAITVAGHTSPPHPHHRR